MKNMWIALPLAAALALPVVAQQNTNDQNQSQPAASQPAASQPAASQPAASQQQEQPGSPEQNTSARQPLTPQTHEGFWGHLNPFARKKYVQKQMAPIRDRVNELDELTAANSKMITDVDQRATEGIRLASAKANEADQHAVDAGNRAQQANQTAQQASTRLTTVQQVVTNIDQYQPVTQAEIHFRPGQTILSKQAKEALDQIAQQTQGQQGYIIEVQGFSAGRGRTALENSQNMADAAVRYLVIEHQIPVYRIYTLGMGNAPVQATSTAEGTAARRIRGGRVEVSLMKNGVSQLAQAGSSSTTTGTEGGVTGTTAQPQQQQQQQAPAQQQPATNTQTPPPTE
jgi:outer membrane protein OmpA-like peptidoglycan-associated protein